MPCRRPGLGAEIVAAPLEVAAAAIGAAGEVVTSALGGSPGRDDDNGAIGGRPADLLAEEIIGARRLANLMT